MGGIGGLSGLSALGFPSLRGAEADALLASLDASNEAGLMAMLAGAHGDARTRLDVTTCSWRAARHRQTCARLLARTRQRRAPTRGS
eukprot:5807766-Pleurochrysis_carterae.AAC.1